MAYVHALLCVVSWTVEMELQVELSLDFTNRMVFDKVVSNFNRPSAVSHCH